MHLSRRRTYRRDGWREKLRLVASALVASALAAACGASPDVDNSRGELTKPDADAAQETDAAASNDATPTDATALDAIEPSDADEATDASYISDVSDVDAADCILISVSDAGFCWDYGRPSSYHCPNGPIRIPDPDCVNPGGEPEDGGSLLCCP